MKLYMWLAFMVYTVSLLDGAVPELIAHDTLMCQSRKSPSHPRANPRSSSRPSP